VQYEKLNIIYKFHLSSWITEINELVPYSSFLMSWYRQTLTCIKAFKHHIDLLMFRFRLAHGVMCSFHCVCVLLQLHIFMFEDFVHILDSVVYRRREKPWSRSSLDNTTHTCSSSSSVFTSSYTLSLLYCFHRWYQHSV